MILLRKIISNLISILVIGVYILILITFNSYSSYLHYVSSIILILIVININDENIIVFGNHLFLFPGTSDIYCFRSVILSPYNCI